MEIKGKVYCFFEQSGTFKNEFRELGYEAEDQPEMLYKYFNILLRQLFCRVAKRLYLCLNKQTN